MLTNFTFTDVISDVYWEIDIKDIYIGGKKTEYCDDLRRLTGKCGVAIDSGTSLYAGPSNLGIKGDCSNFDKLPNIEIKLNARVAYQNKQTIETKIVLKPEDYIIEGSKIKEKLLVSGKEDCQPAFMAMDVPSPRGPIFVFGEYFLRKFYTVFDRDQKVFGFSLANHDSRLDTRSLNLLTPYDKLEVEIKSEEKELELCR